MDKALSVVIITRNEERNIRGCLASVRWADEVVVVDSGSTDNTVGLCRQSGCRVIETEWLGFGRTKRLAVDSASNDWILALDADEQVSASLRQSIADLFGTGPDRNGYRVKRRTFYLGREVRHCGWNHDYPVRLFHRKHGNFNERTVHESVQLSGPAGTIEEAILHYSYPTVHSHLQKMERYAELGAEAMLGQGRRSSVPLALLHGAGKFLKMYVWQLGFLDGQTGFLLALHSAFGVYWKYVKLWEQNR